MPQEDKELLPAITGTEANDAGVEMTTSSMFPGTGTTSTSTAAGGGAGAPPVREDDQSKGGDGTATNTTTTNCKRRCIGYCCCCFVVLIIIAVILGFTLERNETDELYFSTCERMSSSTLSSNVSSFGIGEIPSTIEPIITGTEQPNFDAVPIYQTYLEQPELYHRLIIHVLSLERAEDNDEKFELFSDDPEAILTVTAKGPDTGSADYFTIGQRQFRTTGKGKDTGTTFFEWDEKVVLIYKAPQPQLEEGDASMTTTTESIEFYMIDKDTVTSTDTLMKFSVPISELPQPGGSAGLTDTDSDSSAEWIEYSKVSEVTPDYDALKGSKLIFRMKVLDDYITTPQDMKDIYTDTDTVEFREHVLTLASGDHALVQAWRHITPTTTTILDSNSTSTSPMNSTNTTSSSSTTSSTSPPPPPAKMAVLWIIGRNDGFMHPHVLRELFLDQVENDEDGSSNSSFDVYILHWRFNGRCLARGFMDNPLYNSHNPCGDADLYNEEMNLVLDLIQSSREQDDDYPPYEKLIGYAHSTGAAILLNYIIEMGSDDFDGFIFNSPFLDWAQVGWLSELVLDYIPDYFANSDYISDVPDPINGISEPIEYLGQDVILNTWAANGIYPFYYSDWADRGRLSLPVTVGFVRSANSAFDKINSHNGPIVPSFDEKPILVLTSQSDDVLSSSEIRDLSRNIHPDRILKTYRYNAHDVFLSHDYDDVQFALNDVKMFLQENF